MPISERAEHAFNQMGLRDFNTFQLQNIFRSFQDQMDIGLKKRPRFEEPNMKDRGLLCISTLVHPITRKDWNHVPDGGTTIVATCGGTNWTFSLLTKEYGKTTLSDPIVYEFTKKNKKPMKFAELIDLMARNIELVAKKEGKLDVKTISIAFGFAQENIKVPYGIDAAIPDRIELTKDFKISDADKIPHEDRRIGKALLQRLRDKGILKQIDYAVILNDVNALSHFITQSRVKKLPASIVAGSGTSGAVKDVNLEAEYATMPKDKVYREMRRRSKKQKWIPEVFQDNALELYTGGYAIKYRALAGLGLLAKSNIINKAVTELIINKLFDNNEQDLVSRLADGTFTLDAFNKKFGLHLNEEIFGLVCESSRRALRQAGQLIGVLTTAIALASGYDGQSKTAIPAEGGVLKNGFGVKKAAYAAIKDLLPGSQLTYMLDASSIEAIGQLGLVWKNEHLNKMRLLI